MDDGLTGAAKCYCKAPRAWLSLDENDNDLRQFLSYFIAAVETIFPDAVSATMTLVDAPTLPPLSTLASSLANELDAIEQDFILVLDDFHYIREKSAHHFLNLLLRHPPRPMHLVMVGRRDPFLDIATLRARSQLAEIRIQDLRFTTGETATYLQQILKQQIDEDLAATWSKKTEGWVTGLRLAALSFQHRADFNTKLPELQGGTQYVMESILINLDGEDQWFRYHHLFKDLLNRQLRRHHPPNDIKMLHSRASEWFESQGLITESINQACLGGRRSRAGGRDR
jgi:LuxR family maltose regulon positive regulatory protein